MEHTIVIAYCPKCKQAEFHTITPEGPVCKACRAKDGDWRPACGGTETPFTSRNGFRLLYCWQPSTGRHAYLNLDTDIILSDEEARAALGMF